MIKKEEEEEGEGQGQGEGEEDEEEDMMIISTSPGSTTCRNTYNNWIDA